MEGTLLGSGEFSEHKPTDLSMLVSYIYQPMHVTHVSLGLRALCSPIKNAMLHLNPIFLRHLPHGFVHIIIHTLTLPEELLELAEIEICISRQQDEPKDDMVPIITPPLCPWQIGIFGQRPLNWKEGRCQLNAIA